MPIDQTNLKLLSVSNDVAAARAFTSLGTDKQIRQLPGHSTAEYELFVSLAYKIEAVPLTVAAFVGMIMEPAPVLVGIDDSHKEITDDLNAGKEPINRCIATTLGEVIRTGRHIALAEYPVADTPVTRARAKEIGLRPFAAFYEFEDLIDWKTEKRGANKVVTQVRLYEAYEEQIDEWTTSTHRQIRVLFLDEDGNYGQQVYRQSTAAQTTEATTQKIGAPTSAQADTDVTQWDPIYKDESGKPTPIYPTKNRVPLKEIPIVFFGPDSLDIDRISKPPITPLVNTAISHLNNSALREWALMWCGAATLVIAGEVPVDDKGVPLPIRIGSSEAIVLGEGGSADLLQATKDAVGAITDTMDKKEQHMAAAGARMLTDGGSSNISTETALLERVGQFSTVASIAKTTGEGYVQLLTYLFDWKALPIPKDFEVKLNTNYVPQGIQPGELRDWIAGVQAGQVPLSAFINFMRTRGAVSAEMSDEDYRAELDKDADEFKLDAAPLEGGDEPPVDDDGNPIEETEE